MTSETEPKAISTEPTIRKALEDAFNGHIIAFTKVYPNAIDDLLTSLAYDGFEITRIGTHTAQDPDSLAGCMLMERDQLRKMNKELLGSAVMMTAQNAQLLKEAETMGVGFGHIIRLASSLRETIDDLPIIDGAAHNRAAHFTDIWQEWLEENEAVIDRLSPQEQKDKPLEAENPEREARLWRQGDPELVGRQPEFKYTKVGHLTKAVDEFLKFIGDKDPENASDEYSDHLRVMAEAVYNIQKQAMLSAQETGA